MTDDRSAGVSRRSLWTALAIVAVLALLPYARLPGKPLIYDAPITITGNPVVQSGPLSRVWSVDFWGMAPDSPANSRSYRPLVTLSYALQWRWFGDSAALFHLTDMALHGINALLLFLVVAALGFRHPWPLVAGAIFALHPVQSEAVISGVGRADLLANGCLLGAIWLQLQAQRTRAPWAARAGCVVLLGAAMLCKEYAVAFPFLLAAITYAGRFSRSTPAPAPAGSATGTGGDRGRGPWITVAASFVVLLAYLALRVSLFGSLGGVPMLTASDHPLAGAPFLTRFSTALTLVPLSARLLLAPFSLNHHYRQGTLPLAESPFEPLALLGLTIVAVLIVVALRRMTRGGDPVPAIAVAWIGLPLLPSLNLVSLSGVVFAERFLYVPVGGYALLVAHLLASPLLRTNRRKILAATALAGVAFTGITLSRVEEWSSEERLARASLAIYPGGSEVRRHLGVTLRQQGRHEEAAEELKRVVAEAPADPQAWRHYAATLDALDRVDEAVVAWRRTLELSPDHIGILWRQAGLAELRAGNLDQAAIDLDRGRRLMPEDPTSLYYYVQTELRRGEPDAAAAALRAGETAIANDREALEPLAGQALLRSAAARLPDDPDGAIDRAREALTIPSLPAEGWFLAGLVADRAGAADLSRNWFDTALGRDPELLRRKNAAALELEQGGQRVAAAEQYREILVAIPDHVPSLFNLGRVLVADGRPGEAIAPLERGLALQADPRAAALLQQARRLARGN